MQIIKDLTKLNYEAAAVTIGKFDGVHIGHRKLVDKVLSAKVQGAESVFFTFDKGEGQKLLHRNSAIILTEEEKQNYLCRLGMDAYVLFPFSKEVLSMEPEQFVKDILVGRLHMKYMFVGKDFRFGKKRSGDVALLSELAKKYGFTFEAIEKETYAGDIVSSTRIRTAIAEGEPEQAAKMLGYPYFISGEIVHGNHLGHSMGIPTINQEIPAEKIMPAIGVYCARVTIEGKIYQGIANVGCKPTVQKKEVYNIETHLFDCEEDLYGKQAKTELLHHVRREQKFASLEALIQQLEQDKIYGRNYFKA